MEDKNITITFTKKEIEIIQGCVYKIFNQLYMFNKNADKDTVKVFQDIWSKIKGK